MRRGRSARTFRGLAPVAAISSFARSASPNAHAAREVDALPEPLACLDLLVGAAEGCAEIDEGVRVFELSFRALEHLDRLAEQCDSLLATFDPGEHAERGADCTRITPTSSERELLGYEHARFVCPIEQSKTFGGPAAPGYGARIVKGDEPNGLAHLEQLLDSPLGVTGLDAQTPAVEPKPREEDLIER